MAADNDSNKLAEITGGRRLLLFALPTIVMMIFSGLYTIVDTVFVSYFVGTDALAAVNIVTPVISLTVGIGTMFAAGGNAIIAENMGAGKGREAKENFTLIVMAAAAAGVIFAAAGYVWLGNVLHFLGAEGVLFFYAEKYLGVLLLFLPAYMLQTVFANLFVTAGHPGLGSVLAIGSSILNIILDYLLIVMCGMGIRGAAVGTGIGVLLPVIAGLAFFARSQNETLSFCRPYFRGSVILEACLNGSSEMVSQLSGAVTTFLFNRSMLRLAGEDGVAAITIINYSQFLFQTFYIGFSMGAAPVIGYNHGSRDRERQRKLRRWCVGFIAVSSVGIFLMSSLGADLIAGIFTGADGNVYSLAAWGLRLFSFGFLFSGFNIYTSSMFTALSDAGTSALLSFLRTFVFLTAAILLLPFLWGVTGVWLTIPAAEFLAFLVSVWFMRSRA